jgi:hypothetical protein
MFSTCIHCSQDLGRNEAIESFQVGTRLAFDPKRGRLWVICRRCERWNLSPLEERWEAIETAEARFREARLRVSSDNVGMARLREGLDLIRIGDPMRPEMAAWRYGDQFGRRRRRQLLMTGAGMVAAAGAVAVGWSAGIVGMLVLTSNGSRLLDRLMNGSPNKVVARIPGHDGQVRIVERTHARMSLLERSDSVEPFWLTLRHRNGEDVLHGDAAARAAAQLLPVVNRFGGSKKLVRASVDILEERGSALEAIRYIQQTHGRGVEDTSSRRVFNIGHRPSGLNDMPMEVTNMRGALHTLPARERLALEMALHEERERRAMDGELQELERAWRSAEEVASIADNLLVDDTVTQRIDDFRGRSSQDA